MEDDGPPPKRRRPFMANLKNSRVKRMLDMSLYYTNDENNGTASQSNEKIHNNPDESDEEVKGTPSTSTCQESTLKSVEEPVASTSLHKPNLECNKIATRRSTISRPLYSNDAASFVDDSDEEPFSPDESEYIPDTSSESGDSLFGSSINKCVKLTPRSMLMPSKEIDTPDSFKEILTAVHKLGLIRCNDHQPFNEQGIISHNVISSDDEPNIVITRLSPDSSSKSQENRNNVFFVASTSTVYLASDVSYNINEAKNTRDHPLLDPTINDIQLNDPDNISENTSNMEIGYFDSSINNNPGTSAMVSQSDNDAPSSFARELVDNLTNSDFSGEPNVRPRKRKRDESSWAVNKNKVLKNLGKEYCSRTSNVVRSEKRLRSPCKCRNRCSEKIDENERLAAFNYYWSLGDHTRQWDHICHLVKSKSKRVQLVIFTRVRTQTLVYTLPKTNGVETVCKKMFLRTFDINEKTVYTALDKREGQLVNDLRGKHQTRANRVEENTTKSVIDHINMFPRKESHYLRKQTKREYLDEKLNRAKMYRLYMTWIKENQVYENVHPATERWYSHIFNTKFNLGFFQPKKDLCGLCSLYEQADSQRKRQLEEEYMTHIKNKEIVRQIKDAEKTNSDPSVKTVACFDLEKVLSLPQSEVGVFHYKRKYPVYNFTVFNILTKTGYCYVWHAQIAKRGANEIASCLWHFIQSEAERGIKEVSFYSDNCTGQNRNRFVFALYSYASRALNIKITHRFLQKGHTQNEGDSMHSCIERYKKNQVLYVPDQMYSVIRNCKVNGQRYNVKEMTQEDMYDVKQLVDLSKNWEKNTTGEKVLWTKIKEISVDSPAPATLRIKYDFEAESVCLETNRTRIMRKKRSSHAENNEEFNSVLKQLYHAPLPISQNLYKDLMSLCKDNYIPPHYHDFYKNLRPQASIQEINSDMEEESD